MLLVLILVELSDILLLESSSSELPSAFEEKLPADSTPALIVLVEDITILLLAFV